MTYILQRFLSGGVLIAGSLSAATAQPADEDLIAKGQYIATAANCMACHVGTDGTPYAGGNFIETPLGAIMGTNITSSKEYGIGNYSEADLAAVLHEGKAPDHMLYPAMPYPDYHGMSDEDVTALYAYLQTIPPIDAAPEGETNLDFPFNMRFLMRFWDVIALGEVNRAEGADAQVARGQYLVDHLGHCGTCHTPRDALMMSDDSRYMGGAMIQGWEAPNITSDPVGGLGNWGVQDIVDYLKTGRAMNAAQAAGPMGEVVHYSTGKMTDDDLTAMAVYLKTVPALETEGQTVPVIQPEAERTLAVHKYGSIREELSAALAKTDLPSGETLYLTQCAACHGVQGKGQTAAYYPTLTGNGDLRRDNPANLVNVIAQGVTHATLYRAPLMPGFARDLDNAQIADVANYTRVQFGGLEQSDLTEDDIALLRDPRPDLPLLIKNAAILAWIGIIAALAVIAGIVWLVLRKKNKPSESQA